MAVNLKVRLKNPVFIIQVLGAGALAVLSANNLAIADINSVDTALKVVKAVAQNPAEIGLFLWTCWSAINDPTTTGIGDSPKALTYTKPNLTATTAAIRTWIKNRLIATANKIQTEVEATVEEKVSEAIHTAKESVKPCVGSVATAAIEKLTGTAPVIAPSEAVAETPIIAEVTVAPSATTTIIDAPTAVPTPAAEASTGTSNTADVVVPATATAIPTITVEAPTVAEVVTPIASVVTPVVTEVPVAPNVVQETPATVIDVPTPTGQIVTAPTTTV